MNFGELSMAQVCLQSYLTSKTFSLSLWFLRRLFTLWKKTRTITYII